MTFQPIRNRRTHLILAGTTALATAGLLSTTVAFAETFEVNTYEELRNAITDANESGDGQDTITFTGNIAYDPDSGDSDLPEIKSDLTIETGDHYLSVADSTSRDGAEITFDMIEEASLTFDGQAFGGKSAEYGDGGAGIDAGDGSELILDADTTVTGGDGDNDGGTGIELGQNGWAEIAGEITGGDGDTFDGGAGIDAGDGNELMLDTDTTVTGGGGDDGGAGIEAGNESTLTLDADTTVTGGDGDDDGGTGIELGQNGWAEIAGEITGGDGDTFDGGAGIDAGDGSELMLDTDTTVTGGGGDDGGAGIEAGNESTLTLDADTTVTGGDGDDDGGTGIELGQNGWAEITGEITGGDGDIFDGGAGIEADSAIIIISGTVSGGFGNGTTEESDRAAAIELEGAEDDTNELELRAGFEINGIVDATEGEDDSLILGGTENAAFNSNLIGDGQQYQGFESYDKTGDSSWTLEGSGDQDWNVMGGNLAIDENASLGGVFDVAADGVIGGTGTIGDLLLSGVLNPGASVGTLEVDNDATFESGSAYIVEVDQSGADRLEIGGTASLAGDVLVESLEADEDESVLGDYTILSANAGLEGKFDGVGANHSFLIPLLSYSENDVVLRLAASGDLESLLEPYAEDPNAERFVDTLDDLDTDDPGYQAFENALLLLQSGQEGDAVDELSGETIPGFDSSVIQMANNFLSSIQGRISGGAGGGTQLSQGTSPRRLQLAALDIASSDADPHARQQAQADASGAVGRHAPAGPVTWARAVGNRSQLDASGSFPGVKARSAGVHAGIEAPLGDGLGDGLMVGGALGFERGQLESGELASSDFDAYSAGLYARQRIGALRLSGSGTFTQMSLDSQRQVTGFGTQEANYDAQVFALDAEAAYDIPLDETMTVSPLVGLRYSHTHRESYEEDGTAGLNVASTSETSVRSRLGAELAMELDPAVLSVRAAWSRELASPDASTEASLLGGDDFTIEGQTIPENLAEVGLGLDVQVDDNVELFAAYDGAFSSRYRSHSGQLGVRVTW